MGRAAVDGGQTARNLCVPRAPCVWFSASYIFPASYIVEK